MSLSSVGVSRASPTLGPHREQGNFSQIWSSHSAAQTCAEHQQEFCVSYPKLNIPRGQGNAAPRAASFLGSPGISWRGQEDTPRMWHSLPREYSTRKSLNPCCCCPGEPGSGAACLPRLLIFILPGVIGYSKQPLPLRRETSDIFIYTPLQVSNCCVTKTGGRHLTRKTREIPAGAKRSSRCSDKTQT